MTIVGSVLAVLVVDRCRRRAHRRRRRDRRRHDHDGRHVGLAPRPLRLPPSCPRRRRASRSPRPTECPPSRGQSANGCRSSPAHRRSASTPKRPTRPPSPRPRATSPRRSMRRPLPRRSTTSWCWPATATTTACRSTGSCPASSSRPVTATATRGATTTSATRSPTSCPADAVGVHGLLAGHGQLRARHQRQPVLRRAPRWRRTAAAAATRGSVQVTEGTEVVDAIGALGTGDGPPSKNVVIDSITITEVPAG